jgi:tripartite-type tricarboxylate transporter receptor subunit TctC
MKFARMLLAVTVAVAATVALVAPATAQQYPNKPVKIIMPFPTGTGPDTVMRLVGEKLTRYWGQQVIVENKPGGNAWIALEAAKRSPADGYTLLQVDAATVVLQPHLYKKLPFDPFKDFEPVAPLYTTNYFVVVGADSPWQSIPDLVAAAKAKKGDLTYGSSGIGSQLHMGGAMMETAIQTPMTHIPYKETTQIYTSISSGDITWAFGTGSTVGPLYRAKKVKFLAIAAPQRNSAFPEVPTLAEAGGPSNFELRTWVGVLAPAGVPKPILEKINADIAKAMQEPDVRERLETVGFRPWPGTAGELAKAMDFDYKQYGDAVKRVKVSLD